MNPKLSNVHEDARPFVAKDVVAVELAEALTGIFYVTAYRRERHFGAQYAVLFCKPTKTVAQALLIDREVAGIITNFSELHARTLQVVIFRSSSLSQRTDEGKPLRAQVKNSQLSIHRLRSKIGNNFKHS